MDIPYELKLTGSVLDAVPTVTRATQRSSGLWPSSRLSLDLSKTDNEKLNTR